MSDINVICDRSYRMLKSVPKDILEMDNLKMLYMDGNLIEYLPNDFFQLLPKLYWFDVRSNKLRDIPTGIANHKYLENILLQNNNIESLPNELGLVPKLKVLQLSGNPLIYPPQSIIDMGVDDVCIFLKQEYYKENKLSISTRETDTSSSSLSQTMSSLQEKTSGSVTAEYPPVITVASLNKRINQRKKAVSDNYCYKNKKIHRVTKSSSKLAVHSLYNSDKYVNVHTGKSEEERIGEQCLKELWLDKLKDLIRDQEKIIQQEKSLQALRSWRKEKSTPSHTLSQFTKVPEAPYDTNPEYNKLMSRQDLAKNIDQLIAAKRASPENQDIDKLISEVVSKLRGMEIKLQEHIHPDEKLKNAEKEIQMIVELHKRIADIQAANNVLI